MEQRERPFDDPHEDEKPNAEHSDPQESGLSEARDKSEALFAAGDDAIRKALSADSQKFLRANRQSGGQ